MNTTQNHGSLWTLNCKIHTFVHREEHHIVEEFDHLLGKNINVIERVKEDAHKVKLSLAGSLRWLALQPLLWASKCSNFFANHGHPLLAWVAIVLVIGLSGFVAAFLTISLLNFIIGFFVSFFLPVGWLSLVAGVVLDVVLVRQILMVARH